MGLLSTLIEKFKKNTISEKSVDVKLDSTNANFDGKDNILVYAPKNIAELNRVIECVKSGQSVIVNFGSIKKCEYISVTDYLSGALFAINANINRLQDELFIITPQKVSLSTLA